MLTLNIEGAEGWDDDREIFVYDDPIVLQLEHSLVSLSKWEMKFHKLFLTNKPKTEEEMAGYIEAMVVGDCPPDFLSRLQEEHIELVDAYINNPMTGTTFANVPNQPKTSEQISSELIYFWMSQYNIGQECEHWHLNRLFTLIRVHHAKTQKPKKMGKQEQARSMAELNRQRRNQSGSTG